MTGALRIATELDFPGQISSHVLERGGLVILTTPNRVLSLFYHVLTAASYPPVRDINPHIPQYISQAPWYVDTGRPTLKHQRPQEEKQKKYNTIAEWYIRGETGKAAKKYRKGACENCGAMTHSKKDCMERPRKTGAKFTSKDIKPDEVIQPELDLSYDGKRDRWNGYNPDWHQEVSSLEYLMWCWYSE